MKKLLITFLLFLIVNYCNAQTYGRYTIKSIACNKILEFANQSKNQFPYKQLDIILSDLPQKTYAKLWEIGGGAIRHLPTGKYLSYDAGLNKLLLSDVWHARNSSWNVNAASLNRSTIVHSSGLYLGIINATKSPSVLLLANPCNTAAQNCEALLWNITLVEAYVQVPSYDFGTICPSNLIKGDREFNGNGPQISGKVELEFRNNKTEIWATVFFEAIETGGDVSHTKQTWEKLIYTSPSGKKIKEFAIPTVPSTFNFISIRSEHALHQIFNSEVIYTRFPQRGTNNQPLTVNGNVVHHLEIVGDTGGDDISNDTNCSDDTRINKLTISSFQIVLQNL